MNEYKLIWCIIIESYHSNGIHMLHFIFPDDVQEAYNLIQDLVPTTPQVMIFGDIEL